MFRVGLNPYGICTILGIQGHALAPKDSLWYLGLAESFQARSIEFHFDHLAASSPDQLAEIQARLVASSIQPIISGPWPLDRICDAFPLAQLLGVRTIRTHLSSVLSGARAECGPEWNTIVDSIRATLPLVGRRFSDAGLMLAIENHQDFGSEELLEFCELGGESVGVCLDTGNPLAVAETPLSFAERVAPKVVHVHLKDYRAQYTPDGYRLVRCPIGDGAIPLTAIESILSACTPGITATLEPGALQARHIKLQNDHWWQGYRPKSQSEIDDCLEAASFRALSPDDDYRTPFERGDSADSTCHFEMEQVLRSIQNMKSIGWIPT